MTQLLTLSNLSCERDDRQLFQGLSISAHSGDLWQVVGPNGAGKTTLLRMLAGLYGFYQGSIDWQLENPLEQELLYLGHQPGVREELTPQENLDWWMAMTTGGGDANRNRAIFHALNQLGLSGYEDVPVAALSAGQKRRVALARLWLSPARIWVLDEPFTALDQDGVVQLELRLAEHAASGGLVIYTSHHRVNERVKRIELGQFASGNGMEEPQ